MNSETKKLIEDLSASELLELATSLEEVAADSRQMAAALDPELAPAPHQQKPNRFNWN
jgi:hypothetical protein